MIESMDGFNLWGEKIDDVTTIYTSLDDSSTSITFTHLPEYEDDNSFQFKYIIDKECDLTPDIILKTVERVQKALVAKVVKEEGDLKIENIECSMTPSVKENLIYASRRLSMYGKKKPIIASFDEYGRRLPDEMRLFMNRKHGMIIKIVDPDKYGKFYLSFVATKQLPF